MQSTQVTPLSVASVFLLVLAAGGIAGFVIVSQKNSELQTNYDSDRQETMKRDTELLLLMMSKLAEISESKALKTHYQVFSFMHDLFSELAAIRDIETQRTRLCNDPTTVSAFDVTPDIQRAHARVCDAYDGLLGAPGLPSLAPVRMSDYQNSFNNLLLALIELDNALSQDP